jgi:P27 family predicted phage terminase small subunit
MTAGRPPIPFDSKVLRGNPGQRRLKPEPQPPVSPECPDPPAYITGYAAQEWRRLAPELHRLGRLTTADMTTFEAFCPACGESRRAEERLVGVELLVPNARGSRMVANPLIEAASLARREVLRFASAFGLTPTSRSRVSIGKAPGPSKFGNLIEKNPA